MNPSSLEPQHPTAPNPYGQPAATDPWGPNAGAPQAWPYGFTPGTRTVVASGSDPGLELPYYGIGPVAAVLRGFRKYVRFQGRASRSEYWWWQLTVFLAALVPLVLVIVGNNTGRPALTTVFGVLFYAVVLAAALPTLALGVRRLHDANLSGLLLLLNLIPSLGVLVVLVLMALPSKPEGAQYDPQPTVTTPAW